MDAEDSLNLHVRIGQLNLAPAPGVAPWSGLSIGAGTLV
jgi:hypothetical protein